MTAIRGCATTAADWQDRPGRRSVHPRVARGFGCRPRFPPDPDGYPVFDARMNGKSHTPSVEVLPNPTADHRSCARRRQLPEIALAHLRYQPQTILAEEGGLTRHAPEQIANLAARQDPSRASFRKFGRSSQVRGTDGGGRAHSSGQVTPPGRVFRQTTCGLRVRSEPAPLHVSACAHRPPPCGRLRAT
jgi:hypothetical protein